MTITKKELERAKHARQIAVKNLRHAWTIAKAAEEEYVRLHRQQLVSKRYAMESTRQVEDA